MVVILVVIKNGSVGGSSSVSASTSASGGGSGSAGGSESDGICGDDSDNDSEKKWKLKHFKIVKEIVKNQNF